MKYFQLLFFPVLFVIYALLLNINSQAFQDIVAILMGIVGGVSAIVSLILYAVTRRYGITEKWYARLGISLLSCILTFGMLIVFARFSK